MARYRNLLPMYGGGAEAFRQVQTYLEGKKFKYVRYHGESVFQKGIGFWKAPTFIKVSFGPGAVLVEAWIKQAILPGVFVGEYGMTGSVGCLAKGTMKRCVPEVERILREAAAQAAPETEDHAGDQGTEGAAVPDRTSDRPVYQAPVQPMYQAPVYQPPVYQQPVYGVPYGAYGQSMPAYGAYPPPVQAVTCPRCGAQVVGGKFCDHCGEALVKPQVRSDGVLGAAAEKSDAQRSEVP